MNIGTRVYSSSIPFCKSSNFKINHSQKLDPHEKKKHVYSIPILKIDGRLMHYVYHLTLSYGPDVDLPDLFKTELGQCPTDPPHCDIVLMYHTQVAHRPSLLGHTRPVHGRHLSVEREGER